jgi:hypothetical protein
MHVPVVCTVPLHDGLANSCGPSEAQLAHIHVVCQALANNPPWGAERGGRGEEAREKGVSKLGGAREPQH